MINKPMTKLLEKDNSSNGRLLAKLVSKS
jgi:hypothetical protein